EHHPPGGRAIGGRSWLRRGPARAQGMHDRPRPHRPVILRRPTAGRATIAHAPAERGNNGSGLGTVQSRILADYVETTTSPIPASTPSTTPTGRARVPSGWWVRWATVIEPLLLLLGLRV